MKTSRYKLVILLLILLTGLSACSVKEKPDAPEESQVTPESLSMSASENVSASITQAPETAEISEEQAEPEPTPEIKTIELWVPPQFDPQQNTETSSSLEKFVNQFMNDNPGTAVKIRVKASSGDSSMLASLSAAKSIAPNVVPSLVLLSRSDMETAVQKGLIQAIETDVFSDSASWYNYARQSAVIDNTVYGIPVIGDALVLAYRVSKIGAGLTDWNDVLTRGMPIAFTPITASSLFGPFIYRSMGGKFTNDQGQTSLDAETTTAVLNFFLGGGQNGAFPPSLTQLQDQSQAWQRFNEGTMNLIVSQFSSFRHYETAGIKAIALPPVNDNENYPMITTWNICMTETEPELQRIAVQFAEQTTVPEVNDALTLEAGYFPVRNTEHPLWEGSNYKQILEAVSTNGELIPGNTVAGKAFPVLNDAIVQVIKNNAAPEAAAQTAVLSFN